jgi:hypothetical protein
VGARNGLANRGRRPCGRRHEPRCHTRDYHVYARLRQCSGMSPELPKFGPVAKRSKHAEKNGV